MAEEDILFGKNRHLFGGIEPSDMVSMTLTSCTVDDGTIIKIEAVLPSPTTVTHNGESYTLCTPAGAVIRRKLTDYPKNEFDGDLVADITQSTTISDTEVDARGTYYYAAFPYTTQGVYNRSGSATSRCVWNEPERMVSFKASSAYRYDPRKCSVKLSGVLPANVKGVVIRKSSIQYPINETDGVEVFTLTSDFDSVYDDDVQEGVTYYYSAFTYNDTGAYSRSILDRQMVIPLKCTYLYGYNIDLRNSDPDTRVTYPADVDNADFKHAFMNYSSDRFDYGDWPSTPGKDFMPKPCMLNRDGTICHYLDPNNYAYQEDGVTESFITKGTNNTNAMMEWPKIYTHREVVDDVYKFRCSDMPLGDDWDCWCNYDKNDNEIDHFYTAIFTASCVNSAIRSLSGHANYTHLSISAEADMARLNGDDWYIEVIADRFLIQDLLVMMAKTTDCQSAYGNGVVQNSNGTPNLPGSLNTKGMFYGDDGYETGVKVFGMENYWGNLHRHVAGLSYHNNNYIVKLTRGTHDGSTSNDYNFNGTGYINTGFSVSGNFGTIGDYISATANTGYGRLPVAGGGTATTYEADSYLVQNNTETPGAYFGGCVTSNTYNSYLTRSGPFNLYVHDAVMSTITSALSYKPTVEI